ncbi:MAG: glycerate kinase [Exilispira sp.]
MIIKPDNYLKKDSSYKLNNLRKDILESLEYGLNSVDPFLSVNNLLILDNNKIKIEDQYFDLSNIKNIYLVAFGKAALKMSIAIINKIRIDYGIISSNQAINSLLDKLDQTANEYGNINFDIELIKQNSSKIIYIKAGHPLPDENSILAGSKIVNIIENVKEDDLVFILISGGGSALVESSLIPLEKLKNLTEDLLKKGANINELNTIRKHLSRIKGGNLLRICKAKVISLILSDVPGDPFDVIASGPTYFDSSTFNDAYNIFKRFQLDEKFPDIKRIFQDGINGKISDTLKEENYNKLKSEGKIFNILVGSNFICCQNIINNLKSKNYNIFYPGSLLEGNAEDAAKIFSGFLKSAYKGQFQLYFTCSKDSNENLFPLAIIWGGETTVIVKGSGKGGRNQHFVLSFLDNLEKFSEIERLKENFLFSICSFGTDGIDGVSPAAGAIADNWTLDYIEKNKIDLNYFISNSDSYSFFDKVKDAIITGSTGTNVTDIGILLIDLNKDQKFNKK